MQKVQPEVIVNGNGHARGATPRQSNQLVAVQSHQLEIASMKHEIQCMMMENEMAMQAIRQSFAPPASLLKTAEYLFDEYTDSITFIEEIDLYWE